MTWVVTVKTYGQRERMQIIARELRKTKQFELVEFRSYGYTYAHLRLRRTVSIIHCADSISAQCLVLDFIHRAFKALDFKTLTLVEANTRWRESNPPASTS